MSPSLGQGGQWCAGLSWEFKVSGVTAPRAKDSPQVEARFPEASNTNSDKQMRCKKLAGSQRGAGCQAWGGVSPEETTGSYYIGLLRQLLPGQPRCHLWVGWGAENGHTGCPGESWLKPGAGWARRNSVRLENSVPEGSWVHIICPHRVKA